jgi:ABC-2 type transport system ATP-binding protein
METSTSAAPSPRRASAGPVLDVRDVHKSFGGRRAVDGVSFQVAEGETYGLLGPNGAGKSTTISMICGLLERDGGEIVVDGHPQDRAHARQAKRAIGYAPQDLALYPDLSGIENLRFWGRLYGLRGGALRGRAERVLDIVQLTERAGDRVAQYSGGMKRRLNIAASLLHSPRLLILDEPTVGVDPQTRNAIFESVERLSGEGVSVVYTTHYMEEAERLCDRIGIIDQGRIIAEGTRRELLAKLAQSDRVELTAGGPLEDLAAAARRMEGVREARVAGGVVRLLCQDGGRLLPRLLEAAEHAGVEVSSINVFEPDLEAVFLQLTGKSLRDEG